MAEVGVAHPGTSADVRLECTYAIGTQDIANNRTYLTIWERIYVAAYNGAGGPWKASPASSASVTSVMGTHIGFSGGYDLRSSVQSSQSLGSWAGWVNHNADGTMALGISYAFSGNGGTPLGNGSGSFTITFPRIPRGPRVKFGGVWRNTVLYVKHLGVWKIAVLYVKHLGTWKIGGG